MSGGASWNDPCGFRGAGAEKFVLAGKAVVCSTQSMEPTTVATINFKGGVGKTTVTWCLANVAAATMPASDTIVRPGRADEPHPGRGAEAGNGRPDSARAVVQKKQSRISARFSMPSRLIQARKRGPISTFQSSMISSTTLTERTSTSSLPLRSFTGLNSRCLTATRLSIS